MDGRTDRGAGPAAFPDYTRAERRIDGAIHALGVGAAAAGVAVLAVRVGPGGGALAIAAAAIYAAGVAAMLGLSAAYNLVARPDWKEAIRRWDHATIFVAIAASYTPFALIAIGGPPGHALLAAVWLIALGGSAAKFRWPRRFERLSVALYLVQGWCGLAALGPLIAALSGAALALLAAGAALYTVGVAFHLWRALPHHNALWHGCVLVAASCHYFAVLEVVAR